MNRGDWHVFSLSEVAQRLGADFGAGLSKDEAARRLEAHGRNELPAGKLDSVFKIFSRQFASPLIYLLLGASVVVFSIGEVVDAGIIIFVVVFNAVVGTIQEGRAQNTLVALRQFAKTEATAVRDGREVIIPDEDVVPGDVLVLHEGEKVPADARLISAFNLRVDESALTGESEPVHKDAQALSRPLAPPADQRNMLFKGTTVLGGSARALVVATGLDTAIGRISQTIAAVDTEIPLKANVRDLSHFIIALVLFLSAVLFVVGVQSGKTLTAMFLTVVSLAVSVIPEGLPIVLTLVLATGVWRMAKRNALIKKLQAVEALGQARVIAVDKTGTITRNELVVRKVYTNGKLFTVGGAGYDPKGGITLQEKAVVPGNHSELLLAGKIAALAASARVTFSEELKVWKVAGDPTEAALLVFAQKAGFVKSELEKEMPLLAERPFDYRTKYHVTVHRIEGAKGKSAKRRQFLAIAGAPEALFELASFFYAGGGGGEKFSSAPFAKDRRGEAEDVFQGMSRQGLRVVAFGFAEAPQEKSVDEILKSGIVWGGFYGMADSLRPEAPDAVRAAISAGIRVVMMTGDHRVTAEAIAREAGIFRAGDEVLTGRELADLDKEELSVRLSRTSVFARVTPEDKMKIVEGYRARKEIIAMTGDGVNDAPSLVAADLGVAMGKIGTEVAKEAADIVLLDDNFGTIVAAIEEGRSIYKTIKKVLLYLFSTSVGEMLAISGALFLGLPLPILPAQILWLNLVTDGFLDVALAMEPKEEGLLAEKFRRPRRFLVDGLMAERIAVMAIPMMVGSLALFSRVYEMDIIKGWTLTLTTLAIFQWFNAWNCRSETISLFRMNPLKNPFLVGATLTIFVLQLFAVYAPFMQRILNTTALTLGEWLLAAGIAASIVLA
ncbi:MAG: HAD-IC family P-type ATPase, partial [Candidatus Liptonbacteria bacterium]|nr:HAD-IC family P-type ATPase [Candidatus Liptonbacteria bacterium]